ncbi:short chain type dehydrogenase [Penicillium angulare]|uniref:short chain type dehydrogenase n=1 Tax=Penicillium angulare TaxID=116970 RepID=UPI00253F9F3B|nr:short chain type dehydrogenase [Penicillium angulare]KAJ5288965.1 short chain type dehydrogenase [Penicillium angulare]
MYNEFFEGFEPLIATDIAQAAIYMLQQPLNVSVKAMDVVPSGMYCRVQVLVLSRGSNDAFQRNDRLTFSIEHGTSEGDVYMDI